MLAAVVVAVLFKLLNWYVDPTKPSGRKDLILTLAQILGGTALLLGLYFTWRGQQNAQAQLEINRRGQITDRFTQAIDQLGSKDLEIRLGGDLLARANRLRRSRPPLADHGGVDDLRPTARPLES